MLFRKKKVLTNTLKTDDMVLLAMLNFPNGVVGESTIHEFVYNLIELEPYSPLKESLCFVDVEGGLHFSGPLHRAIVNNCRDVTNVERGSFSSHDSTAAIFSDNLRFEMYDGVSEKEKNFAEHINGYSPKVYFLSATGRSVAILALREKLNRGQKKVISDLATLYNDI
jgi:hypothetical protein